MIDFDLKEIEIFCAVVRHGSFSKAAQSLYIAQSSVSERVSRLEEKIGVMLLDRKTRKILPTKAGSLLNRKGLKLLEMKKEIAFALDDFLNLKKGDLNIGSSTIPGEYILPKILGKFKKKYPGIRINLNIADTMRIVEGVGEGMLEAGIVGSKGPDKNLVYKKLWNDELVLVVPARHRWAEKKRVTIEQLAGEPFILRETGSGTRQELERHLKKIGSAALKDFNIAAVVGSSTAAKEAVKSGAGVTIISSRAVEEEVRRSDLNIVHVKNISVKRNFFLVHHKKRALSPACMAFIRFVSLTEKRA